MNTTVAPAADRDPAPAHRPLATMPRPTIPQRVHAAAHAAYRAFRNPHGDHQAATLAAVRIANLHQRAGAR